MNNIKKLTECMDLCGREMTLKEICTNKCCNFCDVPYIYLEQLPKENERLKDKLNNQAFELYRDGIVSFGKAVELADMDYREFIVYCGNKGYGMELSL